jgi:hypothetical protein
LEGDVEGTARTMLSGSWFGDPTPPRSGDKAAKAAAISELMVQSLIVVVLGARTRSAVVAPLSGDADEPTGKPGADKGSD